MTSVASAPKSAPAVSRPATPPPSSAPKLDEAVARAREGAARLLRLSLDERVALARSMQAGYLAVARESVHAACAAKGIPLGTPLEGEEWTARSLDRGAPPPPDRSSRCSALKHTGNTPVGERGRTADGRLTVQVFPAGAIDGTLFKGVRVDVHLQAGVTEPGPRREPEPASTREARTTAGSCWSWAPATSTQSPRWTSSPRCSTRARPASSR